MLLSRITAEVPKRLAKYFDLDGDILRKQTCAWLLKGKVEILKFDHFAEMSQVLEQLVVAQALVYGVPRNPLVSNLVTRHQLAAGPIGIDVASRTNDDFCWPEGPGIMMLDYDPPAGSAAIHRDGLLETLYRAVPTLASAPTIWWPSSSSHICRIGGDDLTGLRGQRLYLPIKQAADIPRAGAVLEARLWLAGLGRVQVSKSGSMLMRTLIDGSVWQPSRLDFAAGAATGPGLEQRRGAPMLIRGERDPICTQTDLPDLTAKETSDVNRIKARARAAARPEAEAALQAWLEARQDNIRRIAGTTAAEESIATLLAAQQHRHLGPDFMVVVSEPGSGRLLSMSVRDLCADPERWDKATTLDPLEPEYNANSTVGILFLRGSVPKLHSKAHGDCTYALTPGTSLMQRPRLISKAVASRYMPRRGNRR